MAKRRAAGTLTGMRLTSARSTAMATVIAVLLSACGDATGDGPASTTSSATEPSVAVTAPAGAGGPSESSTTARPATTEETAVKGLGDRPPCAEEIGKVTAATGTNGCVREDGQVLVAGLTTRDCADGRTLAWNDLGWGFVGQPRKAHERADGQLVAPDEAQEACKP